MCLGSIVYLTVNIRLGLYWKSCVDLVLLLFKLDPLHFGSSRFFSIFGFFVLHRGVRKIQSFLHKFNATQSAYLIYKWPSVGVKFPLRSLSTASASIYGCSALPDSLCSAFVSSCCPCISLHYLVTKIWSYLFKCFIS